MMERHEVREQVLEQIRVERLRQIEMYGSNDDLALGFGSTGHPWLWPISGSSAEVVCGVFRADYAVVEARDGSPTWMHLIREEVAELFQADTKEDRITEAVQVAALCVSLVEHLIRYADLSLNMSPVNIATIIRAYDDGDGGNLILSQRADGYVEGRFEDCLMYEGLEVDGTLYSITHMDGGQIAVAVGDEILSVDGVWFDSAAEARAYIKGLTAK